MTSKPPMECHVAGMPNLIEGGGRVPFELARPRPDIDFPQLGWTEEQYARFWQEFSDAEADPDRRVGDLVYRQIGGRLECVGIHIGDAGDEVAPDQPRPLRASLLHGLPWAGIIAEGAAVVSEAIRAHRELSERGRDDPIGLSPQVLAKWRATTSAVDRWLASATPAVGGGRHDPFFWQAVAEIYRDAWDNLDGHPVKTLASQMGARLGRKVPDSTAKRWVREARRLGYLGRAPGPRQAGYE